MQRLSFCSSCGGRLVRKAAEFARFLCQECHRTHYLNPKVGVALLIVDNESVLLVRRAEEPLRGQWTLPSGYVEYEEPCEGAAVREGLEELGVKPTLISLHGAYSYRDDPRSHMVLVVYEAEVARERLRPGSDASELRFFRLDELPEEIAFAGNRDAISDFIKGRSGELAR